MNTHQTLNDAWRASYAITITRSCDQDDLLFMASTDVAGATLEGEWKYSLAGALQSLLERNPGLFQQVNP